MKKIIKRFTLFEWFMVLSVIIFTIYFALINKENTLLYIIIDSIAAISGIFCVVLCAKGKKNQYICGVINVLGYIVIAWLNKYYGEVMINTLYYLPSQFLGYYLWNKHQSNKNNNVEGKKLNLKKSLLLTIGCLIAVLGYNYILKLLGGNLTLLDSASTIISIVANTLMLLRYREQWLLWIIIDTVTVVMWAVAGDLIMVTMWSVYLINAFYGYYNWTKIVKEG